MKSISYFIIIIKILLNLSKSLYFIKSTENSLNSNELSIPARPEFAFDAYPQIHIMVVIVFLQMGVSI